MYTVVFLSQEDARERVRKREREREIFTCVCMYALLLPLDVCDTEVDYEKNKKIIIGEVSE